MLQKLFEAPLFEEWKQLYRGELSLQKVFWKYGVLYATILLFTATFGDLLFRGLSSILGIIAAIYLLLIANHVYKRSANWALKLSLVLIVPLFSCSLMLVSLIPRMCACGGSVYVRMNTAVIEEDMAMISGAFAFHQSQKDLVINTAGVKDLLNAMLYVKTTKEKQIDSVIGEHSFSCANTQFTCLKLHNGSVLAFENKETFGGKQSNRAIKILIDPDGSYSGKTTSPEDFNGNVKAVALYLYADGFIASDATLHPNTQSNLHHYKIDANKTPLWLRNETQDIATTQN